MLDVGGSPAIAAVIVALLRGGSIANVGAVPVRDCSAELEMPAVQMSRLEHAVLVRLLEVDDSRLQSLTTDDTTLSLEDPSLKKQLGTWDSLASLLTTLGLVEVDISRNQISADVAPVLIESIQKSNIKTLVTSRKECITCCRRLGGNIS
eukprot:SAG11_NODE_540_length_8654_cov_9.626110_7_plen_150_part_00